MYNRNLNKISSNELTTVTDNNRNKFLFEQGLVFKLIDEIISSKKVTEKIRILTIIFENSKINLKINEIIGRGIC